MAKALKAPGQNGSATVADLVADLVGRTASTSTADYFAQRASELCVSGRGAARHHWWAVDHFVGRVFCQVRACRGTVLDGGNQLELLSSRGKCGRHVFPNTGAIRDA